MQEYFLPQEDPAGGDAKREREEKELAEIEQMTSLDKGDLRIVMPQELDSTDSSDWKQYLKREKLRDAWEPPAGSPFAKYEKTKTINSVEFVASRIKPRFSEYERKCVNEISNLIDRGEAGSDVAIILNSGGVHSVAMAAEFAQKAGYQPISMLNSIPLSNGSVSSAQGLAALLYNAGRINDLKRKGKIKSDSPPVFILDLHRTSKPALSGQVDNGYKLNESNLPSFEELVSAGIKKVIYVDEDDDHGIIRPRDYPDREIYNDAVLPTIKKWKQRGIEVFSQVYIHMMMIMIFLVQSRIQMVLQIMARKIGTNTQMNMQTTTRTQVQCKSCSVFG